MRSMTTHAPAFASAALPQDPDFERRVRDSFARQPFMTLMGARMGVVAPGRVEVELPYGDKRTFSQKRLCTSYAWASPKRIWTVAS